MTRLGSDRWNLLCLQPQQRGTENKTFIHDLFPDWQISITNLGVNSIDTDLQQALTAQAAEAERAVMVPSCSCCRAAREPSFAHISRSTMFDHQQQQQGNYWQLEVDVQGTDAKYAAATEQLQEG